MIAGRTLPSALLAVSLLVAATSAFGAETKLALKKGDRICLVGNGLAERMQHFNHFETQLHARFPDLQLVVRNLAFSADTPYMRPRSANFGSPDQHLSHSKADVVLYFFGLNESFGGPAGLEKFKEDLDKLVNETKGKNFSGKGSPRIALISPIAHEDLGDPNLPDGKQSNKNLLAYTAAMAEVARGADVPFVDLFSPTKKLMGASKDKLTINGIHLSDAGYHQLSPILMAELFGPAKTKAAGTPDLARLRAAIAEKNFQWWHRYRALDGFYIYGGRSKLSFQPDRSISNNQVCERERAILDQMTANRDQRIWAIASGKSVPDTIDDSNTLPFIEVKTNFGGRQKQQGKEGTLTYLSVADSTAKFKPGEGYKVNCFASEADFPELQNPVQMTWDNRGRLWVTCMPSYPHVRPKDKQDDKVLILEDTDGDGRADKSTIFARGLHCPTGIELGDGGAYVPQMPYIMHYRDTDGDDVADEQTMALSGFDSADTHHQASVFVWGPGGALYFQEGTFFRTGVETPYGPLRCHDGGVFRFEPKTNKVDAFVSYGFANPWGHIFDRWGQNFVADASGGANYFGAPFSGHVDFPRKHDKKYGKMQFIKKRFRPTAGCEIVSSRHFPDEAQGNFLLNNCIGSLGVYQHRMEDRDSGFVGIEIEPIIESTDRNFRPVDLQFGPDGALYICDWHNALIGHMQHHIRDPNRDTWHGRIWRVTYPSRPLVKPAKIAGESIENLLELLKVHEDRTRYRARRELREHDTTQVVAALAKWTAGLDKKDPEYLHHKLEALWVHQHHNAINEPLLKQLLRAPDHRARAAATRVLCYWRDQVSEPLKLLQTQAVDEHPRVRLEAVRAASFFANAEQAGPAIEIALSSTDKPQDNFLKYTLDETLKTLEPHAK